MHHLAPANNNTGRPQRARRGAQQPPQNFEFMDESDEEEDDDDDLGDDAGPQRRGGSLRRASGAQANNSAQPAAPRDATAVVSGIKHAVTTSLVQSADREFELLTETYEDLLSNLLGLGDSLKRAGAPHDAVMDAAEKLVAVQRASLRRSTALRAEAQGYDPSRFVGRSNENDNGGNGGNGDNEEPGATTTGGGGAGDATDFVGKLAAAERSRRGTRRAAEGGGEDDDDEEDSEVSDDSVAADTPGAGLEQRALDVLNQIREHEYHLHDLRGYAPEQSGRGNDDVMEVRGGGGMRPAATTATVGGGTVVVGTAPAGGPGPGAAAGGHNQALLGGARNARCPLTTKLLADISEPVEDQRGFVYERAAIEQYVLSETAKRVGGRRAGALPPPNSGIEAYPADVVERATSSGVVAPVAGTNHRVALGYLRPARRLLRELAARRAAAGGGGGGGGAFGEGDNGGGAGADADIDISE